MFAFVGNVWLRPLFYVVYEYWWLESRNDVICVCVCAVYEY